MDQAILWEPGIDVLKKSRGHPECHEKVHEKNFKFEQCLEFYYHWYATHQQALARKAINKRANFYDKKRLHETQDSRQAEALLQKVETYLPRHHSYQELQDQIYRPRWRNINNPKEKLIQDTTKFNNYFNWFMKQFPAKPAEILEDQGLGNQVADLTNYIFMFHVDFSEDRHLAATIDDPHPRAIESRFNCLAFRCRLTSPGTHEQAGCPPFEYFEMSYPVRENFQDKALLHEALGISLERRLHAQYLEQKELYDHRQALKEQKQARWVVKNREAEERWHEMAAKKAKQGRRSQTFSKKPKEDPELQKEIEKATLLGLVPFTTDFFDLPVSPPLVVEEKPEAPEPFVPLAPPYVEHLRTDYLKARITRYEEEQAAAKRYAGAQGGSRPAHGNQRRQQVAGARSSGPAGAIRTLVAAHDPAKEKERCQKEDCLFLKWIEAPLGDAKHLDLFACAEDTSIGMGQSRVCRLF